MVIVLPKSSMPISVLRELIRADFDQGRLFWKARPRFYFANDRSHSSFNTRYAGEEALTGATEHGCGGRITINGIRYSVRRSHAIWALKTGEWPVLEIGHRNQDWYDDRFENLREQTESQKAAFGRRHSGETGVKGVTLARDGKYLSSITKDGNRKFLGRFDTVEAACAAYNDAATSIHGQFARLANPADYKGEARP